MCKAIATADPVEQNMACCIIKERCQLLGHSVFACEQERQHIMLEADELAIEKGRYKRSTDNPFPATLKIAQEGNGMIPLHLNPRDSEVNHRYGEQA